MLLFFLGDFTLSFVGRIILFLILTVIMFAPENVIAAPPAGQIPTLSQIAGEMGQCFYCPVVENFLFASSQYLKNAASVISDGMALTLLGLGFVMWLFSHVVRTVFSLNARPKELYIGLVQRSFAVVVAAAFITNGVESLSDVTVEPVLEFAAVVGSDLLATNNPVASANFCDPYIVANRPGATPGESVAANAIAVSGFFSENFIKSLGCLLREMDANIMPGRVVGQALISYSHSDAAKTGIAASLLGMPAFFAWAVGWLLLLPYLYLIIYVPYALMDAFLKIVMVGLLFPLFVVAWVFPSTRDYAVKGFDMVLFSALELITMSFAIGLVTSSINAMLGSFEVSHHEKGALGFGAWYPVAGTEVPFNEILDGGGSHITVADLAAQLTGWDSPIVLKLFLASVLLCTVVKKINELADALSTSGFAQLSASNQLLTAIKDPITTAGGVTNVIMNVGGGTVGAFTAVPRTIRRTKTAAHMTKRAATNTYKGSKMAVAGAGYVAKQAGRGYDRASTVVGRGVYRAMLEADRHASGVSAKTKQLYDKYKDRWS